MEYFYWYLFVGNVWTSFFFWNLSYQTDQLDEEDLRLSVQLRVALISIVLWPAVVGHIIYQVWRDWHE